MTSLKKLFLVSHCLLVMLIFSNGSETSTVKSTNNTLDIFYSNTWADAWLSPGTSYIDLKGSICFPNKNVVLARFEVFNFFFMPHAFDNRYHDSHLELECMVEDRRVDLHIMTEKYKRLRKRTFKTVLISCGIGLLAGSITVLVIKR